MTFDMLGSGNLIFEMASNTNVIRFGPNRVSSVQVKSPNIFGALGEFDFTDNVTGISIQNQILTFSGLDNNYTMKFVRMSNTEYMLSRWLKCRFL